MSSRSLKTPKPNPAPSDSMSKWLTAKCRTLSLICSFFKQVLLRRTSQTRNYKKKTWDFAAPVPHTEALVCPPVRDEQHRSPRFICTRRPLQVCIYHNPQALLCCLALDRIRNDQISVCQVQSVSNAFKYMSAPCPLLRWRTPVTKDITNISLILICD